MTANGQWDWNWAGDPFADPFQDAWPRSPKAVFSGSDIGAHTNLLFEAAAGSLSGGQSPDSGTGPAPSLPSANHLAAGLDLPTLAALAQPSATSGLRTQPPAPSQSAAQNALNRQPLDFEANRGQTDSQVRFLAHGPGYTLFLTPTEVVMALPKPATIPTKGSSEAPRPVRWQLREGPEPPAQRLPPPT